MFKGKNILLGVVLTLSISSTTCSPENQPSEQIDLSAYAYDYSALGQYKNVHPRLYVDKNRVTELRNLIVVQNDYKAMWKEIQAIGDKIVSTNPPTFVQGADCRGLGDNIASLAACYMLSGTKKYSDSAIKWALASCAYPAWGTGTDLDAGHNLYGLALVYDWCFSELNEQAKTTMLETIKSRGDQLHKAALPGGTFWKDELLQNHLWVNITGIVTAGLAVYGDASEAYTWFDTVQKKFRGSVPFLFPDGACQEGYSYSGYALEMWLKYMYLSKKFFNFDISNNTDFFKNQTDYYIYLALPRNNWSVNNHCVDIEDNTRMSTHGLDPQLRALAGLYNNGYAQWLANEIDNAGIDSPTMKWLNLLWYNPTVMPIHQNKLPGLHHFTDLEIVSARSDWSGDESLLTFKCGPSLGHHERQTNLTNIDLGNSHVHPVQNSFSLFGSGEWLIRNAGYTYKMTAFDNTLLVDGKGQIDENVSWSNGKVGNQLKAEPFVKKADSTPKLDYIVGNATKAYPIASGVAKYERHLLFLKPDVLIVVDDIILTQVKDLELRFFPEQQTFTQLADGTFSCMGKASNLRILPLTPDGLDIKSEIINIPYPDNGQPAVNRKAIIIKNSGHTRWLNAVAFSWSGNWTLPVSVSIKTVGNIMYFDANGRTVSLDVESAIAK